MKAGSLAILLVFVATSPVAFAEESAQSESAKRAGDSDTPARKQKRVLTPEERAEKEARRDCKIRICAVLTTKDPEGEDLACHIVKTWREEDIVDMLGGRINWPWGKAVCQSKIALKREPLAKAMSEPTYTLEMPEQQVSCALAQKSEGDPYEIKAAFSPVVTFENGAAKEAQVNWGDVSAPLLIYPMVYAGTGLDNRANVLGPEVARMVNEFTGRKCAEVKDELPGGHPN